MIPSFPLRPTIGKFGSAFSRKAIPKDGNCERFPQVGRDGCNFRFGKKNCRAYFTQLLPDGAPPPLTLSPRWPGTIFVRFSERNRSTIETIIQPVEEDGLLGAVDLGGKLDRIRCTRGLMECVIGAGNRSPFERERTFRCRNHASRRCKREILDFRMNRKFPSVSGIGIGIGRSLEEKKWKIKIYRRRVTRRDAHAKFFASTSRHAAIFNLPLSLRRQLVGGIQEKLIRGPLMAQQKRTQQGRDNKSVCIL